MTERISAEEFVERLGALCVRPRPSLPKRARDRAILLKSALLTLRADTVYSEHEINLALRDWKQRVAPQLGADHVHLRRALVDHGHLARTSDGAAYTVSPPSPAAEFVFDPAVDQVSSPEVVMERRARIAQERASYLARSSKG